MPLLRCASAPGHGGRLGWTQDWSLARAPLVKPGTLVWGCVQPRKDTSLSNLHKGTVWAKVALPQVLPHRVWLGPGQGGRGTEMVGDRLVKKKSLLRGLTGARPGALEELAQPGRPDEGAGSSQAGTGRVGARALVVPGEQPPQGPGLGNGRWLEQRV